MLGSSQQNESIDMLKRQLEIRLERTTLRPSLLRRQRRQARARWWFGQMRKAVETGPTWNGAPGTQVEQGQLISI